MGARRSSPTRRTRTPPATYRETSTHGGRRGQLDRDTRVIHRLPRTTGAVWGSWGAGGLLAAPAEETGGGGGAVAEGRDRA